VVCLSGMNVYCYGSNPQVRGRSVHRLDETGNLHRARLSGGRDGERKQVASELTLREKGKEPFVPDKILPERRRKAEANCWMDDPPTSEGFATEVALSHHTRQFLRCLCWASSYMTGPIHERPWARGQRFASVPCLPDWTSFLFVT